MSCLDCGVDVDACGEGDFADGLVCGRVENVEVLVGGGRDVSAVDVVVYRARHVV